MKRAAFRVVGLRVYCRQDVPEALDLSFDGKHARWLLKRCEDAHRVFKDLAPELRERFLLKAEKGLARLGKHRDVYSLRTNELEASIELGPLIRWPVAIYILREEGRIPLEGVTGFDLMYKPNEVRV